MNFSEEPTFQDVQKAYHILRKKLVETPLLTSPFLDALTSAHVLFKVESLQHTGSFKFRGALNRISQIPKKDISSGVVAFSSGNHGISVAKAAYKRGLPATIFIPEDTPEIKVRNIESWKANILRYNRYSDDREAMCRRFAVETGATVIKSFDDPHVIAGQGIVGIELVKQVQQRGVNLDVVVIPCGGGGLVSGIGLVLSQLSLKTKVYAVEPKGFDDTARSLLQNTRVTSKGDKKYSLCDALLIQKPGEITFPLNQRFLEGCVCVTDEEVLTAMAFAFEHLKIVLEPSGSVGLAAILFEHINVHNKNVAVICSGGNVDRDIFILALQQNVQHLRMH